MAVNFPGDELTVEQRQRAGFNASLLFDKKVTPRGQWVEVIKRQPINGAGEFNLHVSKPIFLGMAIWACSILYAQRLKDESGRLVVVRPEPINWAVYWKADNGHHLLDYILASSEWQACDLVVDLEVMRDQSYAIPVDMTRTVTI